MKYKYVCKYCKANLDPGERCDCQEKKEKENVETMRIQYPYKKRGKSHAGRKVCV